MGVVNTKALQRIPKTFEAVEFWSRGEFEILGVVKVIRTTMRNRYGDAYNNYNLSDDVVEPDGASLFFLVSIPDTHQLGRRYFITKTGHQFVEVESISVCHPSVIAFKRSWCIEPEAAAAEPISQHDAEVIRRELRKWNRGKCIENSQ